MLLPTCVCGSTEGYSRVIQGIATLICSRCKVCRQVVNMTEEEYGHYYLNGYKQKQRDSGHVYNHDYRIAEIRFQEYKKFLHVKEESLYALDIGSSNGAFVDYLGNQGIQAFGIEPSGERIENNFFPDIFTNFRPAVISFDLITFHDVFEHLVDPLGDLKLAVSLLKPKGNLIIDFPGFWCEAGKHHWKVIEHLWMFRIEQLTALVIKNTELGFCELTIPIPSKVVFNFSR